MKKISLITGIEEEGGKGKASDASSQKKYTRLNSNYLAQES